MDELMRHGKSGLPLCVEMQRRDTEARAQACLMFRGVERVEVSWPHMVRQHDFQFVYPVPEKNVTYIYDEDQTRLIELYLKSHAGFFHTPPMMVLWENWATRQYVPGRIAEAIDVSRIEQALAKLHLSGVCMNQDARQRFMNDWHKRVCDRLWDNCNELYDECRDWDGWIDAKDLRLSWGLVHGDPTLANVVINNDEVVFIDHSPCMYGCQQVDLAKLRRSCMIDNALRERQTPRWDPLVGAVLWGMIGTHPGYTRERLLDYLRRMKR